MLSENLGKNLNSFINVAEFRTLLIDIFPIIAVCFFIYDHKDQITFRI